MLPHTAENQDWAATKLQQLRFKVGLEAAGREGNAEAFGASGQWWQDWGHWKLNDEWFRKLRRNIKFTESGAGVTA